MCRVALIDDFEDQYEKYKIRLKKKDIDLIFMDFFPDYAKIVEWLLEEKIEFILIDYKLDTKYKFQGSQLMQYINNEIPDLQCVLFTSNTADDDLVMSKLKIDKSVFNSRGEDFEDFVNTIKQATKVFRNRMNVSLIEYQKMQEKRDNSELSAYELEEMYSLYKRLHSYDLVEYMPKEYFESNIENKIDNLIKTVENYINNKK